MDIIRDQIAMKLGVSTHDILDYFFEFGATTRGPLQSKLKVTVVGEYGGMSRKLDKLRDMGSKDVSIESVTANVEYGSPIISISVVMYLLADDKFSVLVTRALSNVYKVSYGSIKSRVKQRRNAAAKRLASRSS